MTSRYLSPKIYQAITLALLLPALVFAETADKQFAEIASALQNHQDAQALALLGPALQAFPSDPRLWAMQGTALARQDDKPRALESFHHALRLAPDYVPALQGAAQIEYESGNSAAVPLLQRLLKLQPDNLTTHGMLAILQYQQGRCDQAVPHFEKAASLFDSETDALDAYAACLARLKRFDGAAEVLARAVELKPADPRERQVLAAVQLMAHKPQDAVSTLEPILHDHPQADTLELAASAHEDLNQTPQAVELLRQAILLDPQNVSLYVDFALIAAAHQSAQAGINLVSDGIAQNPAAAQLYLARGVLYAQLDQFENAEADFDKAYQLDPSQSLSTAAQGLVAMQKNDLDGGLATIHAKLAKNPNDASLLYLQADILALKGAAPGSPDFKQALSSARKAVALQPKLGPARDVLAKLYLRADEYRLAAEQSREALKIDPKDQTAVYRLIQALRKSNGNAEIPELMKKLASLRTEATREERERNRYRIADGMSQPQAAPKP